MDTEPHRLRAYRKANGLTLGALAGQVESTAATISRIETRKLLPSMTLTARLVAATGLPADAFLPRQEFAA